MSNLLHAVIVWPLQCTLLFITTHKVNTMFMHCDVIDILKHRNEYLKRKEHFINKVVELWNAREPQEITLLASWLELCVVDPDLIAEIYSRLDLGDSLKEIQLEHQHNV